MRKLLLLMVASFVIGITIKAQVTQEQADAIVMERMSIEPRPYELFAKEGIHQAGTVITTSAQEIIELEYESWFYYFRYLDVNCCKGRYLAIKESNSNLMEINTTNDVDPADLEEWRNLTVYPVEIPLNDYLVEKQCLTSYYSEDDFFDIYGNYFGPKLTIINSQEKFDEFITCKDNYYPEIDFSRNTVLSADGHALHSPVFLKKYYFFKNDYKNYSLNVDIITSILCYCERYSFQFLIPKINDNTIIELNVKEEDTWKE